MAEKKDVEINSRADTIDMMHPDIRPYPVTPPPPPEEEVRRLYTRRVRGRGDLHRAARGRPCEAAYSFRPRGVHAGG
jgi:hypothetical protein